MQIKLYYAHNTRAVRPRWLLEELDVPYQLEYIDLRARAEEQKNYKKIHPFGSVPAMDVDGDVIYESGAICQWLADHYAEKGLAPLAGSHARLAYDQWMYYIVATLEPPLWEIILNKRILPEERRSDIVLQDNIKRYLRFLSVISAQLSKTDYLCEHGFSCADIMLMPMIAFELTLIESNAVLISYIERLSKREAWLRASAD